MQTTEVLYLFKRCGIYYFSRRVPLDIQAEYSTKRISFSLRTRNKRTASLGAAHLALQEQYNEEKKKTNNKNIKGKKIKKKSGLGNCAFCS